MALRSVIFDYGMVLTGPQDPESHAALMRITGLPLDRFEALYWADRHAYDEGKLTGLAFWQKLARDAGLHLSPATIDELNPSSTPTCGPRTTPPWSPGSSSSNNTAFAPAFSPTWATTSSPTVSANSIWIHNFDALVWSFQHLMAKPDPAIYRLVLEKLNVQPEESLFLDDKLINVEAAQALGMHAIRISTVDRLRADLRRPRL